MTLFCYEAPEMFCRLQNFHRHAGERRMTEFSFCGVNCSFKFGPWQRKYESRGLTTVTFKAFSRRLEASRAKICPDNINPKKGLEEETRPELHRARNF